MDGVTGNESKQSIPKAARNLRRRSPVQPCLDLCAGIGKARQAPRPDERAPHVIACAATGRSG
jgi:hypothetical protein